MSISGFNLAETKSLLLRMMAETNELKQAAGGSITEVMAAWLAPQYLLAAQEKLAAMNGDARFEILRMYVQDLAMLRRGDHSAERLQLDREELEWQRTTGKFQKEQQFNEWAKLPENHKKFFPESEGGFSTETIEKIERELKLL